MATLPTTTLVTFTNIATTQVVGSEPLLEPIATADDADYVYTSDNNKTTSIAEFTIQDMPTDFLTMDSLSINLRYVQSGLSLNTWDFLDFQVFEAGGTVALTNRVTIATDITNTTPQNSGAITLTGLNTTANETTWNNAVVRIFIAVTKNKGGDVFEARVTAAELTGTYTQEVFTTRSYGIIVE